MRLLYNRILYDRGDIPPTLAGKWVRGLGFLTHIIKKQRNRVSIKCPTVVTLISDKPGF